jgi:hypothetical protein
MGSHSSPLLISFPSNLVCDGGAWQAQKEKVVRVACQIQVEKQQAEESPQSSPLVSVAEPEITIRERE